MTAPTLSESALIEAAAAVAEVFGLGSHAEVGKSWIVDDGDTMIQAPLSGIEGSLALAVNNDVGRRLTGDPTRLASGLGKAVDVLSAAVGAPLVLGEIESGPAMSYAEPTHRIEIRDGAKLCALLGVTLAVAAVPPGEPAGSVDPSAAQATGAAAHDASGAGGPTPFQPTNFGEARSENGHGAAGTGPVGLGPLALLQDVDMEITVELGRTTMPIRDLLALQPGMVVEIDRVAGAPIDVLVNGRRFACGEVVVIDEEFGLRITEIVGAGA